MRLGHLENEEAERRVRTSDRSNLYGLVGVQDPRLGPGGRERQDQEARCAVEDAAIPSCTGCAAHLVGYSDCDRGNTGAVRDEGPASESSVRLANILVFVSAPRPAVGDL
jgi:hypothetical protein